MAEELAQIPQPTLPKGNGRIGFKEAMGVQEPFLKRKAELQPKLAEAEADIKKAEQAQQEVLATGKLEVQQAEGTAIQKASEELKDKLEREPLPQFIPTKDTAQDIAGLFSLIGVIGMIAGKGNAMQAMGAMNGMLEGHRKGRADLYKQQLSEFDKNFKSMLQKHAEFRKEMEDAVKLAATNKEEGMRKAELAAVKSGSEIAKAYARKGDIVGLYKILEESEKASDKALELEAKAREAALREAAADRRAKMQIEAREKIANLRSVGGRSATNERYANTVYRSANETLRSLELIEQIGLTTGGGALGSVVGKGTIPSEVQRYIGQAMTEEQQKNYNTAMSGLALELAYVLNGGYKPDVSTVSKLETYLSVGPNDTAGNAAYKFSDVAAKLKAAIDVSPTYTEDQKKTKDMLYRKLDKYAAPEVVYERAYGIPERREPMVRSGQYPTPQSQAEFDALGPDAEYIDPDDGKLYKKRAK